MHTKKFQSLIEKNSNPIVLELQEKLDRLTNDLWKIPVIGKLTKHNCGRFKIYLDEIVFIRNKLYNEIGYRS